MERKGFDEQRYPVTVKVVVRWSDGMIHHDEIKGLNIGHALYLAKENWSDAKTIEVAK